MTQSRNNLEYLKKNTPIYHSRAERATYRATIINKSFVSNVSAAQAMYELINGDLMPSNTLSFDALTAARFALNFQDPEIIIDLRKLNARPKNDLFDPFWAKMAVVVERRVNDGRHGTICICI